MGCVSAIFKRFVHIISESRAKKAVVIASIRRHGLVIHGSISKTIREKPSHTRLGKFYLRLRKSRCAMTTNSDRYTYRILWSDEDKEFVGLCAEFPSLSWLASTAEEALKGIRSLVKECVSDMTKNKEDIPLPLTARKYSGKFMVRVPPEVHRHLAIEAAESGVSLNRIASAKLAR